MTGSNRRLPACKGGTSTYASAGIHWVSPAVIGFGERIGAHPMYADVSQCVPIWAPETCLCPLKAAGAPRVERPSAPGHAECGAQPCRPPPRAGVSFLNRRRSWFASGRILKRPRARPPDCCLGTDTAFSDRGWRALLLSDSVSDILAASTSQREPAFRAQQGPWESPTRCPYDNEGRSASAVASRPERGSSTPGAAAGQQRRHDCSGTEGAVRRGRRWRGACVSRTRYSPDPRDSADLIPEEERPLEIAIQPRPEIGETAGARSSTIVRFVSRSTLVMQNRSGTQRFWLNSFVWSSKWGDAGLSDCE